MTRVGLFSAAHVHADGYVGNLRVAGAEIVGVADDDAVRGRQAAAAHGIPWFGSYEELLDAGVDGVIVCAETVRHRRLVELAAAAGVAVLCEKPLATTAADSRAIVDACADAGVPLMTAFPMRFSAPAREVRALVAGGALGEVYAATGTNQGQMPARHRAWFADPHLAGGGALMDHVVHLADLLRWYLGAEVTEVYAASNRLIHGSAVGVETGGLLLVTFGDGVFASIDCSWSRPGGYPTWGGLTLELVGERGWVGVDPFRQRLTVYGSGATGQSLAWRGWGSDADQGLIEEFLAVCQDAREPAVTGEDGHAATLVALAAYESVAAGAPVPLPQA